MGFTLGAALAAMGPDARIVVAELVPKVVTWAKGPLGHIFGGSLTDPRTALEVRDVHDVIEQADAAFDAILLDVDNGPDGLIQLANDRLYCNWGLRSAYAALRPRRRAGGVVILSRCRFHGAAGTGRVCRGRGDHSDRRLRGRCGAHDLAGNQARMTLSA
jgi:predicted membrane-bound spermidine synthase